MAKRLGKTPEEKQNIVLKQFDRINKYGLSDNSVEAEIKKPSNSVQKRIAKATKEPVFYSFYIPDNPLNGSSSWTKQEWANYKATGDHTKISI
jgi:hypothetical protein